MQTKTLHGHDAIAYAERHGLTLSKYADPVEAARAGLTPDEARDIAREDPVLIYLTTHTTEEGNMDKRHFYKTAYVKGLNRCCVGLKQYDATHDRYECLMPFGNVRWIAASDLMDFCL